MNGSTFQTIENMNGSVFSKARYMNGVSFEILARTPVPQLPPSYTPPPPPPNEPLGIPSLCHWVRLIIRNNNIYGLWLGI